MVNVIADALMLRTVDCLVCFLFFFSCAFQERSTLSSVKMSFALVLIGDGGVFYSWLLKNNIYLQRNLWVGLCCFESVSPDNRRRQEACERKALLRSARLCLPKFLLSWWPTYWGWPREVRAYASDISLIKMTVTLTISYEFGGGSVIAACTLHLLKNTPVFMICWL